MLRRPAQALPAKREFSEIAPAGGSGAGGGVCVSGAVCVSVACCQPLGALPCARRCALWCPCAALYAPTRELRALRGALDQSAAQRRRDAKARPCGRAELLL